VMMRLFGESFGGLDIVALGGGGILFGFWMGVFGVARTRRMNGKYELPSWDNYVSRVVKDHEANAHTNSAGGETTASHLDGEMGGRVGPSNNRFRNIGDFPPSDRAMPLQKTPLSHWIDPRRFLAAIIALVVNPRSLLSRADLLTVRQAFVFAVNVSLLSYVLVSTSAFLDLEDRGLTFHAVTEFEFIVTIILVDTLIPLLCAAACAAVLIAVISRTPQQKLPIGTAFAIGVYSWSPMCLAAATMSDLVVLAALVVCLRATITGASAQH